MSDSKKIEKKANPSVDDIFIAVGEFSKYQALIFFLVGSLSTVCAIVGFQTVFTDASPEFRCRLPSDLFKNDTYEITSNNQLNLVEKYIPIDPKTDKYDTCHLNSPNGTNTTIECHEWVYSKQYFDRTIITEWNFVCSRLVQKGVYKSIFFAGTFGVILIGILGDRFGRQRTAHIFITLNSLVFILNAIVLNFVKNEKVAQGLFGFLRFSIGFVSNVYAVVTVLAVEIVGPSYRVTAANTINYFFIVGELIVLFCAYFLRDYRNFSICMAAVVSVTLSYFWMVPESIRYLVQTERYSEADKIFTRIARSRNTKYTYNLSDIKSNEQKKDETKKKVSLKDYFTRKQVMLRFLVSLFNWFTTSFVYYGISFNTEVLGGDPYLNYLYSTLVELAGVVASHFILDRFGRKKPYVINFIVIAISLISIGFVPYKIVWLKIALVLIAKFAVSFNFNAIYIVTAESYPTIIRNTALSTCSIAGRIGSTISPYNQLLGTAYWGPLPFLIHGVLAVFAAISYMLVMPETKDIALPETLDDACD